MRSSGFCVGCEARAAGLRLSSAELWPGSLLQTAALDVAARALQLRIGAGMAFLLILFQSLPSGFLAARLLRQARPKSSFSVY